MTVWLGLALASAAMTQGSDAARLLDQLDACRSIAADAERLRCFDQAAAAVLSAKASKDIVVLDKTEVRKTKRSLFGFSLPSIRLFGDGADDAALKQVSGALRNSATLPGGLVRFELDEGGVWETTETPTNMMRKGDVVTVKAGSLGSYVATAPGRRAVRVRRIR